MDKEKYYTNNAIKSTFWLKPKYHAIRKTQTQPLVQPGRK
jgi:hypothetical protein